MLTSVVCTIGQAEDHKTVCDCKTHNKPKKPKNVRAISLFRTQFLTNRFASSISVQRKEAEEQVKRKKREAPKQMYSPISNSTITSHLSTAVVATKLLRLCFLNTMPTWVHRIMS